MMALPDVREIFLAESSPEGEERHTDDRCDTHSTSRAEDIRHHQRELPNPWPEGEGTHPTPSCPGIFRG